MKLDRDFVSILYHEFAYFDFFFKFSTKLFNDVLFLKIVKDISIRYIDLLFDIYFGIVYFARFVNLFFNYKC